jgi:hypothetical protein
MTSGRALALAIAVVAASAVAARAQTLPWPGSQPTPGQAAWPTNAPPAGPTMAPGPTGPPMGPPMSQPMGPPGMNATQQDCLRQFGEYRQEVEKRALTTKAAGEKKASREEMCKLVTLYSAAEGKWLKFSDDNMARCGIPKEAIAQIRGVHLRTADAQKKLCAAGPAQAGPAAPPSLSDALGTTRLPSRETEQRKPGGGTLDTLTGTAIQR